MKQFYCECGATIFFDSNHCIGCGSRLGFDPDSRVMLAISPVATEPNLFTTRSGQQYKLCENGTVFDVCNWLIPLENTHPLCWGCQFNRTVPNQALPHNDRRWRRLEEAKKRLLFTLMSLEIPLSNGWADPKRGLLLDFIEDSRSQPLYAETFVTTGFLGGIITINALEADEVARITTMLEMNENYRTVLGHLRHESGHYYWSRLDPDATTRADFVRTFGDPDQDYQQALERYYRDGPPQDWRDHYISSYASAHPAEDWAESWGHYLHIYDALETAAGLGIIDEQPDQMSIAERIETWRPLSLGLNELNRSVGHRDAYPFVINSRVAEKLAFVDRVIVRLRIAN